MNIIEVKHAVKHLQKNCPCIHCNAKYRQKDISIFASTRTEGLFELKCHKCNSTTIVTLYLDAANIERTHQGLSNQKISKNDVLDIKNFLSNFDGNFKKIFKK